MNNLAKLFKTLSSALHAANKTVNFCTNKNGAGFEHWQFYQSYLDAGVDRLYEMGTYLNHSHTGGPSDRENVTRQLQAHTRFVVVACLFLCPHS